MVHSDFLDEHYFKYRDMSPISIIQYHLTVRKFSKHLKRPATIGGTTTSQLNKDLCFDVGFESC